MTDFLHRTWAEIDLDAVRHNFTTVSERLSPACTKMAIVKADAYGHGALPVAKTLVAAGADAFGVSNIEEAVQLRRGGITNPILILSYTPPSMASLLSQYDLLQTVLDLPYAEALEAAAAAADVTVRVHIKLDTGMSRVGFFCQDQAPLSEIVAACSFPHLKAEGVFTHFAVADEPSGEVATRLAFTRFIDTLARLQAVGITFSCRHCCNSAAALRFPEMQLDMVRLGIVLYGAAPSDFLENTVSLQPAMTLKTIISQTKTVPADVAVGYGHTYRTDCPSTLATLPIGYADGLQRLAAGHFSVTVNGRPAPFVGRICMDQCVIDVSDTPTAVGNAVTVFGKNAASAADYAAACQTIAYESLCLIGKRVPRVYYENNTLLTVTDLLQL